MTDEQPAPDPDKPFWTMADIAALLKVKLRSVQTYRGRGELPDPDDRMGNSPVWFPTTILAWLSSRPGQGTRTDLQPPAAAAEEEVPPDE